MIEIGRLRVLWPTRAHLWEDIAESPQLAPLLVWRGTWKGHVAIAVVVALAYVLNVAAMLVPRYRGADAYGGGRAHIVFWLFWRIYVGPPLTQLLPPYRQRP